MLFSTAGSRDGINEIKDKAFPTDDAKNRIAKKKVADDLNTLGT